MLRLLLRFIGFLLLAAAFASLVVDGTQTIAEGALTFTPLDQTLAGLFPRQFPFLKPALMKLHPALWDPAALFVLQAPIWTALGLLGFILLAATRKRREPIGLISR